LYSVLTKYYENENEESIKLMYLHEA